jgi:hypothetical protein
VLGGEKAGKRKGWEARKLEGYKAGGFRTSCLFYHESTKKAKDENAKRILNDKCQIPNDKLMSNVKA